MRDNIKKLVDHLARKIAFPEPIVEIGSLQVPGQEGFAELRPFFSGKQYIGCDMRKGPGVDRIENLEHLSFKDKTVGTVLMLDTIEHVAPLQKAMDEIYRVLRPDGWLVMSSVMDFPIHEYPEDYWRFTPKGFEYLLKAFPCPKVYYQGASFLPHTVIGIGYKGQWSGSLPSLEGWTELNMHAGTEEDYTVRSFAQAWQELKHAQEGLRMIRQRRSWRWTAPLRRLYALMARARSWRS